MKKKLLLVLAVVGVVAAILVPTTSATTAPGYNFYIGVYIKANGSVVLTRSVARRGWLTHFILHNQSKKTHVFDVGGLARKLKPGGKGRIGAYTDTRGQYPYKVDGKVRGYFTVI